MLYATFQQGLRLSDEVLEQELLHQLHGINSTSSGSKFHPFKALKYLKKICVHPSLIADQEFDHSYFRIEDSGKLCRLVYLLIEQNIAHCSIETQMYLQNIGIKNFDFPNINSDLIINKKEVDEEDEEEEGEEGDDDNSNAEELEGSNEAIVKYDENNDKKGSKKDTINSTTPQIKKCLIFAEHRATLDIIQEHIFKEYFPEVNVLILDGRTPAKKRGEISLIFNSDDKNSPQILLVTTSACGLGLNLSSAEIVIFIEHSWNPFVDLQAMDRVHRLGQKNTVTVFKLLGFLSFFLFIHFSTSLDNLYSLLLFCR